MEPILRRDGEWTVYRVEVQFDGDTTWHAISDSLWGNIPQHLRFDGNPHNGCKKEPHNSFSANGPAWQETGLFGSYDFEIAQLAMVQLAQFNPGHRFRVVRHFVKQERTQIAEYHVSHEVVG